MSEKWGVFILLLFLVAPASARPPAWIGIVDPSRAIDWSSTGVGATIVTRTTQCGSTIAAYGGPAAVINSALASCNDGYVLLGPGTFTLSTGIDFGAHNNVTLRGSGPLRTVVNFAGGDRCGGNGGNICAYGGSDGPYAGYPRFQHTGGTHAASWAAGYAQGGTHIQLESNGSTNFGTLTAGMTIILDQEDDATDTKGVYVCQTIPCSTERGGGQGRRGRSQIEMKQVVAINGSGDTRMVSISPGLHNTNWRTAQHPGAWWGRMITGVGIEDLTLNHRGSGEDVRAGIFFNGCHDCWIVNVRSLNANRNHVWCYLSSNVTLRNSYLYGTLNSASQSYGFEGFGCSHPLIENNIFQHVTLPVQFDTTIGGVVGYNYTYDEYYTTAGWQQAGLYEHASGTSFNLWEGNESPGYNADDIHGSHNQETLFRNWLSGLDTCSYGSPCKDQTVPVILQTLTRGINIIGNVLGCYYPMCNGYSGTVGQSYYTNYEDRYDVRTTVTPNHTIYVLGYCQNVTLITPGNGCSTPGGTQPNDTLTPATLFRWGNYDTATGTVRWQANEVPTGAVPYMNGTPVPASHTLPASFYMMSKPAWWGAIPWPAIGPDVTGGTGPGGHAYDIPAAVCYNRTTKDSTGILLFDANACYR